MGSTLKYSPSKPNFGRRKICSSKIKITYTDFIGHMLLL